MAQVRLIAGISGTRDGQPWPPVGSVVDLPDDEAASMVANGTAAEVDEPAAEEQATASEAGVERATPKGRGK